MTTIGGNAFYGCTSLKEIRIGSGVTKIVNGAFKGCPLQRIYNYAKTPQEFDGDFDYMNKKDVKVYVLKESLDLYRANASWRDYDVQAMSDEEVGIKNVNDNANLNAGTFYDLNGRQVTNPTKGIYIQDGKKVIMK